MSHNNNNSGYSEEDTQSIVSSSDSEEYLPKSNALLGIESDSSADEMNFIGQHPTNLPIPVIPMNMAPQIPRGAGQFCVAPPGMAVSVQDTHETSEDILEFMSKQSKIIGSNMMEEMTSPIAPSAEKGIQRILVSMCIVCVLSVCLSGSVCLLFICLYMH